MALLDKLLDFNSGQKTYDSNSSNFKYNRDYLLDNKTAEELNTYLSFGAFPVLTDIISEDNPNCCVLGVRSIFNKQGAVLIGSANNVEHNKTIDPTNYEAGEWRLSQNVPLIDNVSNRTVIKSSKHYIGLLDFLL